MESIVILNLILTIAIIIVISVYATFLVLKKQPTPKKIKKEPEPKKITSITQFSGETEEQKKKRLYLESLPPEARAMASGKK